MLRHLKWGHLFKTAEWFQHKCSLMRYYTKLWPEIWLLTSNLIFSLQPPCTLLPHKIPCIKGVGASLTWGGGGGACLREQSERAGGECRRGACPPVHSVDFFKIIDCSRCKSICIWPLILCKWKSINCYNERLTTGYIGCSFIPKACAPSILPKIVLVK